ncbi:MAG: glycosyltransferase, partial [Pseudonocardia sp.]
MTSATEAAPVRPATGDPAPAHLLQRVILPRAGDPTAVRSLYVDERQGLRLSPVPPLRNAPPPLPVEVRGTLVGPRRLQPTSRTTAVVPEQSEVSFGAYFNAFPASYWRRWSVLTAVQLRLDLEGEGRVDVYRTKADGAQIFEASAVLQGGRQDVLLDLDLRPFEDGGWYWFDLTTDTGELTLHGGGWYAAEAGRGRAAVAIGMPTFNRPADAVATLTAIGADPLVLDAVTAVLVADQGTRKVRDQDGFEVAAARLGDRLRVLDQANLGGSGGYARVMHEALGTACEQILFMDDDILLEPDSILRAVAFSRYSRHPMLVGGQMLSL